MILSLGGVELPPTAAFVSFLFFFFPDDLHTHSDDSVYPRSRDSDRHSDGLEIALYFLMLRPSVRRVQMTFRYDAKKKNSN